MTRTLAPGALLLIAALAGFACGGPPREATETIAEGSGPAAEQTTTALTFAGVPVYPGAEETDAGESARGEHRAYRTGDAPDAVIAFYDREMPALGWDRTSTIPLDDTVTTLWGKPSGETVSISIAPRQGKTDVVVVVRGNDGS